MREKNFRPPQSIVFIIIIFTGAKYVDLQPIAEFSPTYESNKHFRRREN